MILNTKRELYNAHWSDEEIRRSQAALRAFTDKWAAVCIDEMIKSNYRVLASIKLFQIIYESNCGESTLARNANNLCGAKCHRDWNGETYWMGDDETDKKGKKIASCFRVYRNYEESIRSHTTVLAKSRYDGIEGSRDYKHDAMVISNAGYASRAYGKKMIEGITNGQLYKYDSCTLDEDGNIQYHD